jgi:isoleucyl-tRNA synthetase
VYVDVALTPDLEAEGYAREVIRRIQEMRRQHALNVEDFITAGVVIADERVASLFSGPRKDAVSGEVRARELTIVTGSSPGIADTFACTKEWDVEGITIVIGISKVPDQPVEE